MGRAAPRGALMLAEVNMGNHLLLLPPFAKNHSNSVKQNRECVSIGARMTQNMDCRRLYVHQERQTAAQRAMEEASPPISLPECQRIRGQQLKDNVR